jgi:hypothetical protein
MQDSRPSRAHREGVGEKPRADFPESWVMNPVPWQYMGCRAGACPGQAAPRGGPTVELGHYPVL